MKKATLLAVLMMPSAAAFADVQCECRAISYQELLNMTASEIQIKMRNYERLKNNYATSGPSYCYYLCSNEYERLRVAKQDRESEEASERGARQAGERGVGLSEQRIGR